jgi:hypothetical protein
VFEKTPRPLNYLKAIFDYLLKAIAPSAIMTNVAVKKTDTSIEIKRNFSPMVPNSVFVNLLYFLNMLKSLWPNLTVLISKHLWINYFTLSRYISIKKLIFSGK